MRDCEWLLNKLIYDQGMALEQFDLCTSREHIAALMLFVSSIRYILGGVSMSLFLWPRAFEQVDEDMERLMAPFFI